MEASALRRSRAVAPTRSRRLLAALGDDRLVDHLRRGNEVAFEVIYDRHHRGILAFCRHMLGSRDEAEDAVQHTFTSAYTGLVSNDREIRLKAWLYTIARNRCLSMLRARREQPAEIDDQPTAGLSDEVQRREDLRDLLHDLGDLPDDQREALVLFEVGDLSQAEVARVIGVEPMKVKALVFQARSSLIEKREARAVPCAQIREQLATATGGALRRGPLRRHLRVCEGCREYRDQVREQRTALALVLPVVPTVGLKEGVLSAIGFGGGAGGAGIGAAAGGAVGGSALGGAGAGGGLLASIAGVGGIKLAVAAVIAGGGLVGGGVALQRTVDDAGPTTAEAADTTEGSKTSAAGGGGREPGGATATPVADRGEAGGPRDERGGSKNDDDRGKDDEEHGDDERGDRENRRDADDRGERRGTGRKGSGQRRGSDPGSRRGGKGRSPGRRGASNTGRRGGKGQRGPKRPTGTTGGNTGSGGSSGSTSTTDTTGTGTLTDTEETREAKPPRIEPETTADGTDGSPKPEPKDRLVEPVPMSE